MKTLSVSRLGTRFAYLLLPFGLLTVLAGCASAGQDGTSVAPEAADPIQLIAVGAEVYGNNCARCHNARAAAEKTDVQWDLIVAHMRARANLTGGQARAVQAFLAAVNAPHAGGGDEDLEEEPETHVPSPGQAVPEVGSQGLAVPDPPAYHGPFVNEDLLPPNPSRREPPIQEGQEALVGKGRSLATAKGCIGCHVVEEKGGTIGPSLDGLFDRREEEFVREKLKNPSTDNPNSVMPNYGLSDEEIGAFMAYLKSLGSGF